METADEDIFQEIYGPSRNEDDTRSFIQWKGTNACVDLVCPRCNHRAHFDGYFLYAWKCSNCSAYYAMPIYLTPIPIAVEQAEYLGRFDLPQEFIL